MTIQPALLAGSASALLAVSIVFSTPLYRSVVVPQLMPSPVSAEDFTRLANRFGSSEQGRRYAAIAQALRTGSQTYTYQASEVPMQPVSPTEPAHDPTTDSSLN
ncbi:hypothetical protein HY524_00030 [Candidatus Berkelbacteria bacterium]|nr:hypothetical protein [Candidatus Berkelbacteria bacterium]